MIPRAGLGFDHLRRRRVRVFRDDSAGEQKVDQVGDQQHLRGAGGNARSRMSEKLKKRVEGEELNASAGENFGAWRILEDLLHHPRRSPVAVADRVFDKIAVGIDQPIINPPTVYADAHDWTAEPPCPLSRHIQSDLDVREDALQIPAQTPLASDRRIMKPVRFLKQQFARRDSDEKNAPASGAEINRDVERVVHWGNGERGVGSGEWGDNES